MYMSVCLHVCMCTSCVPSSQGDDKRVSDPWKWSYKQLGITTRVLRTKFASSERAKMLLTEYLSTPTRLFFNKLESSDIDVSANKNLIF